jgi:hypothetical protein
MFTTTTVTGDNPDNPNNNETTYNARYLQTFKEPSIIKASTTEGYIWRRAEMNLFMNYFRIERARAYTCWCNPINLLFLSRREGKRRNRGELFGAET